MIKLERQIKILKITKKSNSLKMKTIYNEAKKRHEKLVRYTKTKCYTDRILHSDNTNKTAWNIINILNNKSSHIKNITIQF